MRRIVFLLTAATGSIFARLPAHKESFGSVPFVNEEPEE